MPVAAADERLAREGGPLGGGDRRRLERGEIQPHVALSRSLADSRSQSDVAAHGSSVARLGQATVLAAPIDEQVNFRHLS
jgi:hypothetical protein